MELTVKAGMFGEIEIFSYTWQSDIHNNTKGAAKKGFVVFFFLIFILDNAPDDSKGHP